MEADRGAGVILNESKLIMESREVRFLGHTLNENGILPYQAMVDKIRAIKLPTNKKELSRFLGLVQFYGRLIPKFAEMCRPLHELRLNSNMGEFEVTQSAVDSLCKIKEALSSKPCIKPSDLNAPVCLRVDASEYSVGGVLLQHAAWPSSYVYFTNADYN